MDQDEFDRFVKRLSSDSSRRGVLKHLWGGALGSALALMVGVGGEPVAAGKRHRKKNKPSTAESASDSPDDGTDGEAELQIPICHRPKSRHKPWVYLEVGREAVRAHKEHGDVINPDFQSDPKHCGGCGIACGDGDPCTIDTCEAGLCVHRAKDCSQLDRQCKVGVCNPNDGACEAKPAREGETCQSADLCEANATCADGSCVGAPKDCSSESDQCNRGVCDPTDGACKKEPAHEGDGCDDGDPCSVNNVCRNGVCKGTAKDCTSQANQCNESSCDPVSGQCVTAPINEGSACDDGNVCTTGDVCRSGACQGSPVDCSAVGDECNTGVCDAQQNGICRPMPAHEGGSCNGGNGTCVAGTCESICVVSGDVCTASSRCCRGGETCIGGRCQVACNAFLGATINGKGSGTAGVSQCAGAGSCTQTAYVELNNSTANLSLDVYVDEEGQSVRYVKAGTLTTNGSGNAFWAGSVTLATTCPNRARVVLTTVGGSPSSPTHVQATYYAPCPSCA